MYTASQSRGLTSRSLSLPSATCIPPCPPPGRLILCPLFCSPLPGVLLFLLFDLASLPSRFTYSLLWCSTSQLVGPVRGYGSIAARAPPTSFTFLLYSLCGASSCHHFYLALVIPPVLAPLNRTFSVRRHHHLTRHLSLLLVPLLRRRLHLRRLPFPGLVALYSSIPHFTLLFWVLEVCSLSTLVLLRYRVLRSPDLIPHMTSLALLLAGGPHLRDRTYADDSL